MKRRKFFFLATSCVAGLALTPSCQKFKKGSKLYSDSKKSVDLMSGELPPYRKVIKPSFSSEKFKSANDTIVVALIGAGAFGTYFIMNALETGENFRFKYVCDVDDIRGGHAISELEKKQGFKPIRVRDMRKIFDDKEVDAVFTDREIGKTKISQIRKV